MPDANPAQPFEHDFDPEHDSVAARLAKVAADDALVRAGMDEWRFHRLSRADALIRAVELLAQRCASLERVAASPRAAARHVMDEDDE